MNRVFKVGAVALLAISLSVPVMALARVTLDVQQADKTVVFLHERHTSAVACAMCHGVEPTATPPAFPIRVSLPTTCQTCHDLTCGDEPATGGCENCHSDISPL